MAHQVKRLATLIGSALISATALAAPKPFDPEVAIAIANGTPIPITSDEEVVLHSISSCSPLTTPGLRVCQEQPLNLPNTDSATDMIIGVNEEGTPKRFYEGRGDGLFRPGEYFGIPGRTSGLKVADLDNDGDLDMVETVRATGAGDTSTNVVYVNRNGTLQSLFEDEQSLDSAKHDRSSSAAVGDVNNDGRLDVIVANESTGSHDNSPSLTNYLYLNTTSAPNDVDFGPALALDAPGTEQYTRRVLLIDAEGDGDLDLVATGADTSADEAGRGNLLYVNQTAGGSVPAGTNPFLAARPLNAGAADDTDVANGIAAGDLDGDGDPDLVFSTWSRMSGGVAVEATNRYYINNSTPGNINFETTATFGAQAHHTNVRLADVDNDGDLDLLAVVFEGPNVLHRNIGGPGVFDAGVNLSQPAGLAVDRSRGVDVADLNGDGSLDVVIANRDQVGLRYLNNDSCSAAGCGAFTHPFVNDGPHILRQASDAIVPPGGAPITFGEALLTTLEVEDSDNVYPTDFKGLVTAPASSSAEYTCTIGVITNNPLENGNCINSQITPTPGSEANGQIGPISVRVSDGEATSGRLTTFLLTVGTGSAPTFTTSTLPDADEDAEPLYTATITASDAEGNYPLTFGVAAPLPAWLSLVADTATTARLNATTPPRQGDVGQQTVSIRVTDSGGLSRTQALTLTVRNVNDAPSVTTTTLPDGNQGQPYSSTVTGNDEDGTTPTFAATGLPNGLTISAAGVISGTPTLAGTFPIDLTATDGLATSAPVRVQLLIQGSGNRPPTFTAPAAQSTTVGKTFSLNLAGNAADPDGGTLAFSASGLPPGLSLSSAGMLSGSATTASGSPFTVTVTVADGNGGTASGSFQFAVFNNRAPTFTAPGPQSGTVGTPFNLSLAGSATDPDGDTPLTFSATGLPPGVSISTGGLVSGSPTTATGSPFTVTLTVADGNGGTTSGSFQLTVSNPTTNSGGGSGGGGGSLGLLEVLAFLGMAALARGRRRVLVAPR